MKKNRIGELLSRFHHMGLIVKNLDEAVEHFQGLGIGHLNPRIWFIQTGRFMANPSLMLNL